MGFPELLSGATVTSTSSNPPHFPYIQVWSSRAVSQGFPSPQPHEKLLQNFYFTSPRNMQGATDRCQILSEDFAPSKALDAQAYVWHAMAFDSADIHAQRQSFILPAGHNYAPLGAQQDQA